MPGRTTAITREVKCLFKVRSLLQDKAGSRATKDDETNGPAEGIQRNTESTSECLRMVGGEVFHVPRKLLAFNIPRNAPELK